MLIALKEKTTLPTVEERIHRRWHLINLDGQVLGRASTAIAKLLMGKHKPVYAHAVDAGDFVVAINAEKIRLTGNKLEQKQAFRHSGFLGGGKLTPYKRMMQETPERALFLAVKRMLPKNRMASRQILRLKIYRAATHPHACQSPQNFDLTGK